MTNPFEPGGEDAAAVIEEVRSLATWTRLLVLALGMSLLSDTLGALLEGASLATSGRSADGFLVSGLVIAQGLGTLILLPATVTLWLLWQYQAARNAKLLAARPRPTERDAPVKTPLFQAARRFDYGPGTSLLWWFVPFANLILPYRVMEAIWTASGASLDPPAGPDARLQTWWAFWIVSNFVSNLAFRIGGFETSPEASVAWIAAHALGICAAATAISVVVAIDGVQRRAA